MYVNMILAIKQVRERSGLTLKEAKALTEEIAPYLQNSEEFSAMKAETAQLRDELECARNDLTSLIRLVGYFVKHPDEYETWVKERQ